MKQDRVDPQPFPHQPPSRCTCVCTHVFMSGVHVHFRSAVCVCMWRSEKMRVRFFEVVCTLFLRQCLSLVWSLLSRLGLASKPLCCLCFSRQGVTSSCWLYRKNKNASLSPSIPPPSLSISPTHSPSFFPSSHRLKKSLIMCVCVPAHMHKHEPCRLSWRQPSMETMR